MILNIKELPKLAVLLLTVESTVTLIFQDAWVISNIKKMKILIKHHNSSLPFQTSKKENLLRMTNFLF